MAWITIPAAGLDQSMTRLEIELEKLLADGFDHLDRHQLVEFATEVPVILLEQREGLTVIRGCHQPGRMIMLLGRDGRGGDTASVIPRGVQSEAAPSGTDFQQVIRRLQLQALADAFELVL